MADCAPGVPSARPPNGDNQPLRRRREALKRSSLALAAFAFALALAHAWSLDADVPNIDYYQYWVVGHAIRAGHTDDIYSQKERVRLAGEGWIEAHSEARRLEHETLRRQAADFRRYELGTYSTPWLYTTFAWLVSDDYDADQLRFQHASLLCLVASVFALTWMLDYSLLASLLWSIFVVIGFAPVLSELRVGNVNRIQLGFLVLCLLALRSRGSPWRWLSAGFVLALGVLFKPSLGAVVLTLSIGWGLARRPHKLLFVALGGTAGGLLALALSSWYFPVVETWLSWLREVPTLLAEFDHNMRKGNFSLVRLAKDGLGWGRSDVFALCFLVGVFAAALLGRRRARVWPQALRTTAPHAEPEFALDFLMVGLGATMPLLASDLAWLHYYILALPLFIFALRPVSGALPLARRITRGLGLCALVLVAGTPLRPLLGMPGPLVTGALAASGALCLYCIGLFELFSWFASSPRPGTQAALRT